MATSVEKKDEGMGAGEETAEDENISYLCMKYNRHQQGDQLACQDPGLYCKYRSSCLIHFKEKEDRQGRRRADSSDD
jgi:hypothetical protein